MWETAYCTLRQFDHGDLHLEVSILPFSFKPEWLAPFGKIKKSNWTVSENKTLLVFIFIFYISLNVQRVSCSIVKYLYILKCISISFELTLFGSQRFLSHVTYQFWRGEKCYTTNWLFPSVSFLIMFKWFYLLKNELLLLVTLYTYLYLNKTISNNICSDWNEFGTHRWVSSNVMREWGQTIPGLPSWWIHKLAVMPMLILLFPRRQQGF